MKPGEAVLLVHGLWMHGLAMGLIKRRLSADGYSVSAYSYPSMRLTLSENVERLARYCESLPHERLHFVAHSMGGLVALKAAGLLPSDARGRVVLMGTPFAGCYSAHRLANLPRGRSLLGKCMGQWLHETPPGDIEGFEIGIVAGEGGFGMGRLIAPGLPKPHDGVISVSETCVPGMRDHITVPVSHTAMLLSRSVARQVCAFLQHGEFDRKPRPIR